MAAIRYEVEPLDGAVDVVLQSELVANEELPSRAATPGRGRPGGAARAEEHAGSASWAGSSSTGPGQRPGRWRWRCTTRPCREPAGRPVRSPTWRGFAVSDRWRPASACRLLKLVAYGWSRRRAARAARPGGRRRLSGAPLAGWEGLLARAARATSTTSGPAPTWSSTATPSSSRRSGSRSSTSSRPGARRGPRHRRQGAHRDRLRRARLLGHRDVRPAGAHLHRARRGADALRWRHATLPTPPGRGPASSGSEGAAFPWRTIHGEECSGYWPAGTAAFHVNADIADAVLRYVGATGDQEFERDAGLELLVETARLWRSLGHHDAAGRFRIDGVTGPDEYSALADNNVYTNLMAQRNLRAAADAAARHPTRAAELGSIAEERRAGGPRRGDARPLRRAARGPPAGRGLHPAPGWDFEATGPDQYPLLLHFPYFDLYRKQVVKQADLVLALQLRGDAFTAEQKARDFAYYESLTVRDSSLSACIQAVVAAEVGHLDLAYDYLGEAALMDLDDLEHNTRDGLHIASLAGTWLALVLGFGGMRWRPRGCWVRAPPAPRR